jgi:hypothetical protein
MMEAASTSETSVNFYQTTLRNIPEDSDLQMSVYNLKPRLNASLSCVPQLSHVKLSA